jgi:biotin synthesis protein BioG
MITRWIQRKGYSRLLIFFNGWGMDSRIADYLQSNTSGFDSDILLCYDYRSTDLSADVLGAVAGYDERMVVAWSLGVWAASRAGLHGISRALAINGTVNPVSSDEGIPPDIFRATLDNYDEGNKNRFMRRMCGGKSSMFGRLLDIAPLRTASDQREELALILQSVEKSVEEGGAPSWSYTEALIGGRDMIFPPAAQKTAWYGIKHTVVDEMVHFPFFDFSNWQRVCTCMER